MKTKYLTPLELREKLLEVLPSVVWYCEDTDERIDSRISNGFCIPQWLDDEYGSYSDLRYAIRSACHQLDLRAKRDKGCV